MNNTRHQPDIRTIYYRLQRRDTGNRILNVADDLVHFVCFWSRKLLEVFIRKGFGERYFGLVQSIVLTAVLIFWPILMVKISSWSPTGTLNLPGSGLVPGFSFGTASESASTADDSTSPYMSYLIWYVFVVIFLFVSIWHEMQIKRTRNDFDFNKYSLDDGTHNLLFQKFHALFRTKNERTKNCFLDPLPFFILGLILSFIGQNLGNLLILSSLCYMIIYHIEYGRGTNHILQIIDEKIIARDDAESLSSLKEALKTGNKTVAYSNVSPSVKIPVSFGDEQIHAVS